MIHLPVLLALAVLPMPSLESSAPQITSQLTLASLRHDYRPLLVFAHSANEEFRQQMQALSERSHDLQERQVLVVPVLLHEASETGENTTFAGAALLEPAERLSARRRFHISEQEFTVVLVGKDGGEKLKSRTPVTIERLLKLIDSMPTRQKELRDGHTGQL